MLAGGARKLAGDRQAEVDQNASPGRPDTRQRSVRDPWDRYQKPTSLSHVQRPGNAQNAAKRDAASSIAGQSDAVPPRVRQRQREKKPEFFEKETSGGARL